MEKELQWIQGDGGPLVVLQTTAAMQWQGAVNFANSLMNDGSVETDYDVICACEEAATRLERYGRDMLVLSDSSYTACFVPTDLFPSRHCEVVMLQWFGSDSEINAFVVQLTSQPPSTSSRLLVKDTALRLLVGADDGTGEIYGFAEVPVSPGEKVCDFYFSDEGLVIVLHSTEGRNL